MKLTFYFDNKTKLFSVWTISITLRLFGRNDISLSNPFYFIWHVICIFISNLCKTTKMKKLYGQLRMQIRLYVSLINPDSGWYQDILGLDTNMFDPDIASIIYHDMYTSLSWSVYLTLIKTLLFRCFYIGYNYSITYDCNIETIYQENLKTENYIKK